MGVFIGVIGFLGVIVFIIMAIASAFRRNGKDKKLIVRGH